MQQEITNVLSSQKVAATVATATASSGVINWYGLVSDGLGIVAMIAGIALTSILIRKHLFELKMMKEREHIRRKEDKDGHS